MSISYIVQMKNISDLVPFPSAPSLFSCNVVLRSIPFHSIPIPFLLPSVLFTCIMVNGEPYRHKERARVREMRYSEYVKCHGLYMYFHGNGL